MDINELPGVTVSLWLAGQEVTVDSEGCVQAKLQEGDQLILRVTHRRTDVHGFQVDGSKNVYLARNHGTEEYRDYRRVLLIKRSQKDTRVLHTEYPENNVRLVEITANGTRFATYEACLISQPARGRNTLTNRFYLCFQRVYEAGLYEDDGFLSCPRFQEQNEERLNWHSLMDAIEDLIEIGKLPARSEYQPENDSVDLIGLPENGAVVKWYNVANGFGCVQLADGRVASIHWTQAPSRGEGHRRYVVSGERLLVGAVEPHRGTKNRASTFEHAVVATHLLPEAALVS
jgi:hypothetical protein